MWVVVEPGILVSLEHLYKKLTHMASTGSKMEVQTQSLNIWMSLDG